jgi:hypothetical protein
MGDEFETWLDDYCQDWSVIDPDADHFTLNDMLNCWGVATEAMQSKLDAQAKGIEAFRGFAISLINENTIFSTRTATQQNCLRGNDGQI